MSISALKSKNDILDVASKLGIEIDPKSKKALCPFHNDKKPSLQFSKEKQIATCFSGNCSAGTMDVISLVERKLGITNVEALKYLNPLSKETTSYSLLQKLEQRSKHAFTISKQVQAYADFRGLKGDLWYLGAEFYKNWSEQEKQEGEQLGVLKKYRLNLFSSAFKNRLVFFLRDRNNFPVSVYGRAIENNNTVPHLYLKNGQKGLFPNYPKASTKQLILTESIIDAQSLLQHKEALKGYEILALYGTNGLTKEHLEVIKNLKKLQEIIFFFDGDKAGNESIVKHNEEFIKINQSVSISKVETPDGEDINSLMVGHEEVGELFSYLVAKRSPLFIPSVVEEKEVVAQEQTKESHLNTQEPNNLIYPTANAVYSVKGGISKGWDSLKITLSVSNENLKSRLKLDLYEDKQMMKSAREISNKLGLDMATVEMDLELLTSELEDYREGLVNNEKRVGEPEKQTLNEYEKKQAIKLLKSKNLVGNFNKLIGDSGIVGEENNRICLFIIACSYLIKKPLHGLIQGSSGSGKTHLMNKVLSLLPTGKVERMTRVTEGSFYNYEEYFFFHKVLGIEDLDGLEERALFALRELQSSGEIRSSTTTKNELTGEMSGGIKVVRGPIASLCCTTKGEIYEDNMSRSFLIAVDESGDQTAKILDYQQKRAAGLINEQTEKGTAQQIQNALLLLKSCEVI
ncbi:MAG: DNA primase, partial [Flavobacteriales bacterium]